MLGTDVVCFAAGNLVVILDLNANTQICLRTLGGGGVGAIAVRIAVVINMLFTFESVVASHPLTYSSFWGKWLNGKLT